MFSHRHDGHGSFPTFIIFYFEDMFMFMCPLVGALPEQTVFLIIVFLFLSVQRSRSIIIICWGNKPFTARHSRIKVAFAWFWSLTVNYLLVTKWFKAQLKNSKIKKEGKNGDEVSCFLGWVALWGYSLGALENVEFLELKMIGWDIKLLCQLFKKWIAPSI